ncbi:hypothetical protein HanRHA438_Chr04g0174581 [Helianthus annuus]|nr:hypothetical protein HanIR_Chr04g0177961 [Helianthus annuus]KAJ0926723.1 hypothetical protein HanRHA438_Chr04g0174581 [Helianthus annuus]
MLKNGFHYTVRHLASDKVLSYRSDFTRPNSSVKSSSSSDLGQIFQRVRSLSRTEWEDHRKKGLCFQCGQLYGPAHKCPDEDEVTMSMRHLMEHTSPLKMRKLRILILLQVLVMLFNLKILLLKLVVQRP